MSQYHVLPIDYHTFLNLPTKMASGDASWTTEIEILQKDFPPNLYEVSGASGAVSPVVVGAVNGSAGYPFHWQGGVLTNLTPFMPPGFEGSIAWSVNYQGRIVGSSENVSGGAVDSHGWIMELGLPAVDLKASTGHPIDYPFFMNGADQLAGFFQVPEVGGTDKQAFFYDRQSDTFVALPSTFHYVYDLNDDAVVLGGYHGVARAYDHKTGNITVIPALPGDTATLRVMINNKNQIAGVSSPEEFAGAERAFVAQYHNGEIKDLHALDDDIPGAGPNGWQIQQVFKINDNGEIAAVAQWQGSPSMNVLLIPGPAPLPPGPAPVPPLGWFATYMQLLFGVTNDGPGVGRAGSGPFRHIDPHWGDPVVRDIFLGVGILELSARVSGTAERAELRRAAAHLVQDAASRLGARSSASIAARAGVSPGQPRRGLELRHERVVGGRGRSRIT